MKRSRINSAIAHAMQVLEDNKYYLPEFACWTMDDWKKNKERCGELFEAGLGWDVTDFGSEDFDKTGATIYTIRNGSVYDASIGVPYAEKIIIMTEGQYIPMHFHHQKTEDIINGGNGILHVISYGATDDDKLDEQGEVKIKQDCFWHTYAPGQEFDVQPGNSITLRPRGYHSFGAKAGCGTLIAREVSSINDDNKDNRFLQEALRFSNIEEDEPIKYLLCNEYGKLD